MSLFLRSSDYPLDWIDAMERSFDRDFMSPLLACPVLAPYRMRSRSPMRQSIDAANALAEIANDANKFAINVDVSHFTPEEVKVKLVDKDLIIEGHHEEKMDKHGFISRSFKRRYVVPEDVDPQTLTSKLTDKGILHVEAPKMIAAGKQTERTIPIQYSTSTAKSLESGKSSKSEQAGKEAKKVNGA
uniref:SHSP domain-containing protein n=1 Tax=Romanomermis culicivorax TaxID=13658 RepID=A0A915JBR0_ROMCU